MRTKRRIAVLVSSLICCAHLMFSQASGTPVQTPPAELPALEHFSPDIADRTLDPCNDFYKYACGKWLSAHPMPADEVAWGTGGPLDLWNHAMLVEILQKLSPNDPSRTAKEQKIGDYYAACMDEKNVDAHSQEWLKPELDRIEKIKSLSDIAVETAHLHQTIPGAWAQSDDQSNGALMGFSAQPDYDDASRNLAQFDQGGMTLPGRSYYLDQEDKAKEIRTKYVKHIESMLILAGEKPAQAKAEAGVVLAIETRFAKVAMDPILRRDPKNLNNKMSLAQLKALAPSFDFERYLKLVNAPASPQHIVTTPNFFKGIEVMLKQRPLKDWRIYRGGKW